RRDPRPVPAEERLQLGLVSDEPQGRGEEPYRRLLAGGEQVRGDADDVDHLRSRAVGEGGGRESRQDVVSWRSATVLDVRRKPFVEKLQRAMRHRVALGAADRAIGSHSERCPERLVVLYGDAEQVS